MDTSPEVDIIHQSPVPVSQTRNSPYVSETEHRLGIPTLISQLNSPDNSKENDDKEDIGLIYCAKNQSEATKLCKRNFPHSRFMGVANKNPNHFNFVSKLNFSEIPEVLESIDKLKIVKLRTFSDKKTYAPENRHHCHECQVLCQK